MEIIKLHRLPLVPAPDLGRLFGPRRGPRAPCVDHRQLVRAAEQLEVVTEDPRLLRCALTDPGWCNEATTPPWVQPWPGNRALAEAGAPALGALKIDATSLLERACAISLWQHLWLARGQRALTGAARRAILIRGMTALAGAILQDTGGVHSATHLRVERLMGREDAAPRP